MGVFGPVGPIASAAETPEEQAARGAREERERKEQFERETEKASENGTLHCVVPKLTGYSLARASEALQQSHCHLGLTNQPAGRHRGRLIVTGQRPRAGSDLVAGSAVSVTLGRAHRRRARRT
ncbi:MAG: PASTA domain-containing protein [Solirubrobacterales bacterium]|nr:PASTA domain-containing protein [Solirubrobacterales bacterium]